jgi:site-specific recombinase XerD
MKFYRGINPKQWERSHKKGVESGQITPEDSDLIKRYITEYQAVKHVKPHRVQKTTFDLINWRRFIQKPYSECTTEDIYQGINDMMAGKSQIGKPFKQNTKHDYVKALRLFLIWLIENNYSSLPIEKIRNIKVPNRDYCTTKPDEILSREDIKNLLDACNRSLDSSRDRAIIATLYESGCRIGELSRLQWRDVVFDDHGVKLSIEDHKTRKIRYTRLVMAKEYLISLKNSTKFSNAGDAIVFMSHKGTPLDYGAYLMIIRRAAERAGVEKRVHPHLFRKSRITHMIQQNFQESVIKEIMWGNINTNMFKTYAVLSEKDIDDEILQQYGIKQKPETHSKVLEPIQCINCYHVNPPTLNYCGKCGRSLSEEETKTMEEKVDIARKSQDYIEIIERMEKMERELKALKGFR